MKKIILLFFLLGFNFSFVFSQNDLIQKIWKKHSKAINYVEQQKKGNIPKNHYTIKLNQNLPGIGQQLIKYDFYFSLLEELDDPDFYEQSLFFVKKSYNISAQNYYEEFLFENDTLIYFMKKEKFGKYREIRCYFNRGVFFRFSESFFKEKDPEMIVSQKEYSNKNLPQEYEKIIEDIKIKTDFIFDIFNYFAVY